MQVAGNFIGTDPTGETAAPNGIGVVIENSSNLIGGPSVANRNVISENSTMAPGMGCTYLTKRKIRSISFQPET